MLFAKQTINLDDGKLAGGLVAWLTLCGAVKGNYIFYRTPLTDNRFHGPSRVDHRSRFKYGFPRKNLVDGSMRVAAGVRCER